MKSVYEKNSNAELESTKPSLASTLAAGFAFAMLVAAGAASLTLSGCGGASNTAAMSTAGSTFTAIYANTLSQTCANCHTSGGAGSNTGATLDFSSQAAAYSSIFSQVSGSGSIGCGSLRNVRAGSVGTSYIDAVLDPNYSTSGFGVPGCTPLQSHVTTGYATATEYQAIEAWITAGAANN